ncbi:MAG: bifunctional UDP-sugar hydrolase/5'-nucleotidase [Rhodothermaceae bacterium]
MEKIKFTLLLILLLGLSLSAQTVNIKIVETSDVHGSLLPYDFKNAKEKNYSLAQVSQYVKELRADVNQEVILVDNGDILQGTPLIYYYNYERPDQKNIYSQIMNYMKYDAGTVGNHDIETGHKVYDKFNSELNFPWLAANARDTEKDKPYFQPYTIIKRKGIKIAVLGLITPGIPMWLPEVLWSGIDFQDMKKSAGKWVKIIKEKENPDMIVGVFHSGIDHTYGGQAAKLHRNENASQIVAEEVDGFDLIFVGHDHKRWNFTVKNKSGKDVLILGPLASAQTVSQANITFTYNPQTGEWDKKIKGEIVEMFDRKPDPEYLEKFDYARIATNKYVNKPVGKFLSEITTREAILGPSAFMDVIHSFQIEQADADISLAAPLAFDSKVKKGEIFVRDMFNLYKYENFLYTMKLSGKEIKDFLEYSYASWMAQAKDKNDHLMLFEKDKEGNLKKSDRSGAPLLKARFYNFSSASGINYTVDITKPTGEKINITALTNGEKFDLSKTYKVAINSYRGNGGGGHLTKGAKIDKDQLADRLITSTDKDLRFYLMKWIEKKGIVEPEIKGNWKVIPEDLYKELKAKDYKLIFRK